jgi:hypothetical protein
MSDTQLSDADIERLASKLATFAQTLSFAEQAALGRVIVRAVQAAQAEREVQGYFTLIELPAPLFQGEMLQVALQQGAPADGSVRRGLLTACCSPPSRAISVAAVLAKHAAGPTDRAAAGGAAVPQIATAARH